MSASVSIVITSFNAGTLIGQTLESILAQTFQDIEVIVVDGGSTDNTLDIVSSYNKPVRLIAGQRLNKSAGRNVGIRSAEGQYIAFVDADDLWLPEKLMLQVNHLRRFREVLWVYSDCFVFDDQTGQNISTWSSRTRLYAGHILEPLLFDCIVPSPTPVIHRTVFNKVGLFDESLLRNECEDWDMWLRIAAAFPVGLIARPLARWRFHPESLTSREDRQVMAEGVISTIKRALARNDHLPAVLRKRVLAHCYFSMGCSLAGVGRCSEARTLFARALQQTPFKPSALLLWCSTWFGRGVLQQLRNINRWLKPLVGSHT